VTEPGEKKGALIFYGLLVLMILVSLAAYSITGAADIEERFSHAVGFESSEGGGNSGWSGLALEGSPLLYAVVLGILAVLCYAVYRHFSV
jgi:hypothetical protein